MKNMPEEFSFKLPPKVAKLLREAVEYDGGTVASWIAEHVTAGVAAWDEAVDSKLEGTGIHQVTIGGRNEDRWREKAWKLNA